jgi:hypothetical protein
VRRPIQDIIIVDHLMAAKFNLHVFAVVGIHAIFVYH